ncbi:MAG: UPF0175 family protein [Candidatus Aenigmarchaeota archaeon]|nr:UPF0175 family protein [Candidatus Aenigmarchaeota archaeon]
MPQAIGIRLEKKLLERIEKLGKEEDMDRSTAIRHLIKLGYNAALHEKAAKEYMAGKVTLSEAAAIAEVTVWEMAHYLVDRGFKSSYSIEDLGEELKLLGSK